MKLRSKDGLTGEETEIKVPAPREPTRKEKKKQQKQVTDLVDLNCLLRQIE